MVQEALTNVVKHAQARHCEHCPPDDRAAITALIEDDGCGFDPDATREGMGLDGMRERLGLIGGKLKIESRSGRGTTLVAKVPLP